MAKIRQYVERTYIQNAWIVIEITRIYGGHNFSNKMEGLG